MFAQTAPIDGALDESFGVAGIATSDAPFNKDRIVDLAVQSDGKLLTFDIVAGVDQDWRFLNCRLFRWQSDGRIDTAFGEGGVAYIKLPRDFSDWHSCINLAVQSDGKILVAGSLNAGALLIRYHADGRLDADFGVGGVVTANLGFVVDTYDMAVEADGKIVLGVNNLDDSLAVPIPLIARFQADGQLDRGFGTDGVATAPPLTTQYWTFGKKLKLQPDGKIIVVGAMKGGLVARYSADGRLDPAFGQGGIASVPFDENDRVHGVELQADGGILTSHLLTVNGPGVVLRYRADGSLDNGFQSPTLQGGGALVLQADGRALVMDKYSEPKGNWLQRINPDGSIDADFVVPPIDFGPKYNALIDLALQSDGRIVIGAEFDTMDGGRIGLARLLNTTYCLADPTRPERFIGFSDSGWFSTADVDRRGGKIGFVGRGKVQSDAGRWRSLAASGATPDLSYKVISALNVGGPSGWGFANIALDGKAKARYSVLDTHIAGPGCMAGPGR
ncbi:hypothetical protein [Lysobacter sp. CA199]|uniref:hypothetical protein n=1 Tax=Lysobacter sp. CA199 TaxID=3455608 RepID=UPI003F8D5645